MKNESLFSTEAGARPRVVTFAASKGGLGTTLLMTNLGVQLAKKGKSVLLLDAALTEASCHLALGLDRPDKHLGSLASKKLSDLRDAVSQTPVANLLIIAGAPDVPDVANMAYLTKQKIINGLPALPYDYILVDAGVGTGADTLDFVLASSMPIFVCQGNPPVLETFYRFLRALLHRLMQECLTKKRYQALSRHLNESSPLNGLWEMAETRQEDLDSVDGSLRARTFSFVLTGIQSEKDSRLGSQLEMLIRRHFLIPMRYLGGVEWDSQAAAAARSMQAIAKSFPMCQFSMATERLANILLREEKEPRPAEGHLSFKPIVEQNAYEVLDLPFDANLKEIQASYMKLLEPYLDTSSVTVGLYHREQKEAVRDRLEWAYKLLISNRERQRYDEELIAKGILPPEQRVEEYREKEHPGDIPISTQASDAVAPSSSADDGSARRARIEAALAAVMQEVKRFDGESIKKVREAQNISIEEIVSETHIRSWYIESIESERFDALPALVYVKGFVRQIADYLHLDPSRVLADYLQNYHSWRQHHPE